MKKKKKSSVCLCSKFLLFAALRSSRIGHVFFWYLRSEMHVPEIAERYALLLESYLRGDTKERHEKRKRRKKEQQTDQKREKKRKQTKQIKKERKRKQKKEKSDWLCRSAHLSQRAGQANQHAVRPGRNCSSNREKKKKSFLVFFCFISFCLVQKEKDVAVGDRLDVMSKSLAKLKFPE